jgi:hypothetical protein
MKHRSRILLMIVSASLGVSAQAALTLADYQATVTAQNPGFYFTFDGGSLDNSAGSTSVTLSTTVSVGSQFIYDVFQNPTNSIYFTLLNDSAFDANEAGDHIINGGGAAGTTSTASGTITLLFRTVDPGPPSGATTSPGAKCVFSGGGDTTTSNALYLLFENPNSTNDPSALRLGFGDSVTTLLPASEVVADTWYYFALTYDEHATLGGSPNTNKATWYLGRLSGGGPLLTGQTVNVPDAVAGDGASFFLGSQSNGKSNLQKPGDGRVDEVATWTRQLSAAEIQAQFNSLPNVQAPPVSAYQTVVSNQSPVHYFQLAGDSEDSMNPSVVLSINTSPTLDTNNPSVGFCYDYFGDADGAAYFALASDAIYTNANLLNGGGGYDGSLGAGQGSISGMFHALPCTNYYTGQKFIFDAGGGTATTNGFALFLENNLNADPYSLKSRFGESTDVLVPGTNILSEWYYFAVTYDESATNRQVHWWVGRPGGTLDSGFFSAAIGSRAGDGTAFDIGNNTAHNSAFRYQNSSHTGNGQVSQLAIWNRTLSTNEVVAQFSALTAPPLLAIARSGANVVLSWPLSADPAFALESTPSLSSPAWSGAGSPSVVGNRYSVTNALAPNAKFYRLIK